MTKSGVSFNILNIRGESIEQENRSNFTGNAENIREDGRSDQNDQIKKESGDRTGCRTAVGPRRLMVGRKGIADRSNRNLCSSAPCVRRHGQDLELVAKDDELGRRLQVLNMVTRKRAKRG